MVTKFNTEYSLLLVLQGRILFFTFFCEINYHFMLEIWKFYMILPILGGHFFHFSLFFSLFSQENVLQIIKRQKVIRYCVFCTKITQMIPKIRMPLENYKFLVFARNPIFSLHHIYCLFSHDADKYFYFSS
jgi:hypothetical protein